MSGSVDRGQHEDKESINHIASEHTSEKVSTTINGFAIASGWMKAEMNVFSSSFGLGLIDLNFFFFLKFSILSERNSPQRLTMKRRKSRPNV